MAPCLRARSEWVDVYRRAYQHRQVLSDGAPVLFPFWDNRIPLQADPGLLLVWMRLQSAGWCEMHTSPGCGVRMQIRVVLLLNCFVLCEIPVEHAGRLLTADTLTHPAC